MGLSTFKDQPESGQYRSKINIGHSILVRVNKGCVHNMVKAGTHDAICIIPIFHTIMLKSKR